jgi:4-hydroxy-4-methyl-2-oxoglutarate aldolase
MGQPLSADMVAALRAVDSPTLSNAIEAFGVRDVITGFAGHRIRCLFPELGVTVGYAVTVQIDATSPGPKAIGAGLRQLTELVEASPKPVVLVYQDIGPRPAAAATFGEYGALLFQKLGVEAFVTDGAVRDVLEVRALGFQYFAAGASVSHGNLRLVRTGIPVVVDGLYVEPGDLIHGDANGVMTVPLSIADRLPAEVERVRALEREAFAFMRSPDFTRDAALKRMGH